MIPLAALVVVIVFVLVMWWFSAAHVQRRQMKAVPIRACTELVEGMRVRVVGTVRPLETLTAPLTGRTCLYWHVSISERRSGWSLLLIDQRGVDFVVDDGRGEALVHVASGASAALVADGKVDTHIFKSATPALERFLADRNQAVRGKRLPRTFRCYEGVISPGERAAVVGIAWRHPDTGALVLHGTPEQPLLVSDHRSVLR